MKMKYDRESDVLCIRLSTRKPTGGTDVCEGIALLTTDKGEIVEIEIRRARKRVSPRLLRSAAA